MKYACIERYHRDYPITLMCRVLGVRRSGFYAARQRAQAPPGPRACHDTVLRLRVRAAYAASGGTYGAPRVHATLRAEGEPVARKRVARLMREEGLAVRRRRRRVRTTDSAHAQPIAPNHLARRFALPDVPAVNRVWVSDLTYVPTRQGWLYLAVVLDLASRRVVGWATGPTLETTLPLAALRQALAQRRPPAGLLHHSDRGVQYASATYRALLAAHGAVPSMSRRGDCWDNAVAESFFATLERELLAPNDWATAAEARHAIARYLVTWYNPYRRHSTLGYRSPMAYERDLSAA